MSEPSLAFKAYGTNPTPLIVSPLAIPLMTFSSPLIKVSFSKSSSKGVQAREAPESSMITDSLVQVLAISLAFLRFMPDV